MTLEKSKQAIDTLIGQDWVQSLMQRGINLSRTTVGYTVPLLGSLLAYHFSQHANLTGVTMSALALALDSVQSDQGSEMHPVYRKEIVGGLLIALPSVIYQGLGGQFI